MTNTIAWIHADNLNPNQPALEAGHPAIFVWDDELLKQWDISFKRITFIYECLLEMNVTIRRGDVAIEVGKFAAEHNAKHIITPYSPSPRHKWIMRQLKVLIPDSKLEIYMDEPFVDYDGHIDLKRFSRYWRKVEKYAMQATSK
ncbi:MAG: hypothetical protein AAFV93_14395 [Chloroflexota bacterium]